MGDTYTVPEDMPTNWKYCDSKNLKKAVGLLTGILIVAILSLLLGIFSMIAANKEIDKLHRHIDRATNEVVVKHVWVPKKEVPPTR